MSADRSRPFRNFVFSVSIEEGVEAATFSECTIPEVRTEPAEYREGMDQTTPAKLPTLTTYGNVTLRRGVTTTNDLFEWRNKVVLGEEARTTVTVMVLDQPSNEATGPTWVFHEAFPVVYDGPDLNASGNEVAVETLEFAHERMERTA
jgi:phage tail-like protein